MNIEILEKRKNGLLGREEIRFRVDHDGATPKREEVVKKLVSILGAEEKLLIMDSLKTGHGKREAMGYAKIYDDEETLKDVERIKEEGKGNVNK